MRNIKSIASSQVAWSKMKIKIIGINDPLIVKEIAVINQGFFDEWAFTDKDADLEFNLPSMNPSVKNNKYTILATYLKFLETKTGQTQPWGLLNGMRPTKLVHSMKKRGATDETIRNELKKQYLVTDKKLDLLLTVAKRQLSVIPDLYNLEKEVSIYIGIPFCPTKCAYCTFAAYALAPNQKWVAPFLESLIAEIKLIGHYLKTKKIKVTSIYLGGGTPTMLDVEALESIMAALYKHIATAAEVREITVEAGRPDTITKEKLHLLKACDINRLSINPQSFNQTTLNKIGRHHAVADIPLKFKLAKEVGIKNINMDLIVGLPDEELNDLTHSLTQIKALQPESLTVHMLALKRKSKISHERERYATTSKEVLQQMAKLTYEFADEEAYMPYYLYRQKNMAGNMENIGYAKATHESIYNILMMEEAQTILGLGVGASSKFLIGESVHNPKDLRTYIQNYEGYVRRKLALLVQSTEMEAKSFMYSPSSPINDGTKAEK